MLKRMLASLINLFLWIVNAILWIFGIKPVGQIIFNTWVPQKRMEQFVFGIMTVLMYLTVIGWLVNAIFFWLTDTDSLAVRLTKMIYKN